MSEETSLKSCKHCRRIHLSSSCQGLQDEDKDGDRQVQGGGVAWSARFMSAQPNEPSLSQTPNREPNGMTIFHPDQNPNGAGFRKFRILKLLDSGELQLKICVFCTGKC